jgi:hypothetical protein
MPEQLSGVPAGVHASLSRLQQQLVQAAGKNLAGLILYGGLARGRYRPGRSDVNVVVLLHEVSAAELAAIAPALRAARRAAGVVPMILSPDEVRSAAVVFPTKFLDIQEHHIVLYGADPFAGLEVPREQVRLRIVQELRNLALRLRSRLLTSFDDHELQLTVLVRLARPLAVGLAALLRLAGKRMPEVDRTAAIFQAGADAFGVDRDALAQLAQLREGQAVGDLVQLFARLLPVLAQLIDCAERMKEGSS